MRTTLKIDDDVIEAARSLAAATDRTVGEVLSELARKGLRPHESSAARVGFPVFDVAEGAPPLTLEKVRQALEDP